LINRWHTAQSFLKVLQFLGDFVSFTQTTQKPNPSKQKTPKANLPLALGEKLTSATTTPLSQPVNGYGGGGGNLEA
jgi:hypothetical protein